MNDNEEGASSTNVFQATVSVPADTPERFDGLHIDLLPGTERREGEVWTFEALIRADELEELVSRGANVVLNRSISQQIPEALIMSDVQSEERLRLLEEYREVENG